MSQQTLAQIFSFITFFATILLSSNSFAQSTCQNRDCLFPLAAQGLSEPLREVASQSGNARLQHAVLLQEGPRPITAYDDSTGRMTCLMNCPENGETGQVRRHNINVFGADERGSRAATTFTATELKKFSGLGRIECPTKSGTTFWGTAFHVGSRRLLATTAHSFYDPVDKSRISPNLCSVVYYNANGQEVERVRVSSVKSRWDDPRLKGDYSNDIAFIKLESEAITPVHFASIAIDEFSEPHTVSLAGFHSDTTNGKILRRVSGTAIRIPPGNRVLREMDQKNGVTTRSPETLVAASFDSNHGTSGAPVFNSEGQIVGINQGYAGDDSSTFNPATSFNVFIRFDQRFLSEARAVLAE